MYSGFPLNLLNQNFSNQILTNKFHAKPHNMSVSDSSHAILNVIHKPLILKQRRVHSSELIN